jgi:hypothetical protein
MEQTSNHKKAYVAKSHQARSNQATNDRATNDRTQRGGPRPPAPPPTKSETNDFFKLFLEDVKYSGESELEVRFGTKQGHKQFLKNDYDNVVKRLLSSGFTVHADQSLFRIQNEYTDVKSGNTNISNVRTEMVGMSNIQNYCRTNMLPDTPLAKGILFNQKTRFKTGVAPSGKPTFANALEFDDFNFRIALATEHMLESSHPIVQGLVRDWSESKKSFRYINRVSFTHPDHPFRVDMSMVKSSKSRDRTGRFPIPTFTVAESGVFGQPVRYEMEIELRNDMVRDGMEDDGMYSSPDKMYRALRKGIQLVLSGLQGTNFPVSYKEQSGVMLQYMKMIHGREWGSGGSSDRIPTKYFIGPSSVTLHMKNVIPESDNSTVVNIRNQYTVTEKADGDRKMLYVSQSRKVYLITTAMVPEFTGMLVRSDEWANTLLDGEHIALNKRGEFINLYAAFDIYQYKGRDVRRNHFADLIVDTTKPVTKSNLEKFRLPLLQGFVKECSFESVLGGATGIPLPMRVAAKSFQGGGSSIFLGCAKINQGIKDGMYEYETDGLIFTPANMGVGLESPTSTRGVANNKLTWQHSFKWKPPEFNTIDFLVTFDKDDSGGVKGNWIQSADDGIKQYRTMRLRVGYDPEKHHYNNPCGDIMDDKLTEYMGRGAGGAGRTGRTDGPGGPPNQYIPALFFPTEPYDDMAHVANRMITDTVGDMGRIFAENGEVIEDETVVEFRYDLDERAGWRWKPIRVRHDKTEDYRRGERKFGNDYSVANNNWHSIHTPVTEDMISTGGGIPDTVDDEDTYYVGNTGRSQTRGLRDFHNLYVKRMLVAGATKPGDQMIDYAVGKGGDIPKWIHGKLSFVFGLDISPDNIENKMDGCCARYLNYRKQYHTIPDCLFARADTSKLIRTGKAFDTSRGMMTIDALFGKGKKDSAVLGKGVYRMYGRVADGFDVGSIQFALHYMCENKTTFHNFLRNVSETVKKEGRFIATCYDGYEIVSRLREVEKGKGVSLHRNGRKIWGVVKEYDGNDFEATDECLGKGINVFQESINKEFREYLVHPKYLEEQMAHYGFDLTQVEDVAGKTGSESVYGTGKFSALHDEMVRENSQYGSSAQRNYGTALRMSGEEKTISFLNRYYVFKKNRQVDAKKVYEMFVGE